MRALVVEPHDVNELIFASYLSHPFHLMPGKGISIYEGESTEVSLKILFGRCNGGGIRVNIDTPAGQSCGEASILTILTNSQ